VARFVDCKGYEYDLRLTVGKLAVVREETGVDLGKALASEGALADLMFGDPARLASVLYAVAEPVGPQIAAPDPVDFAHGLDGPALERGTEALLAAVADFFPRSKVGKAIREDLAAVLAAVDDAAIAALRSPSKR
jgi:hypothetical protein